MSIRIYYNIFNLTEPILLFIDKLTLDSDTYAFITLSHSIIYYNQST